MTLPTSLTAQRPTAKISHREATRLVSASQFGAGMWLEACPDASVNYTRADSGAYTVALQRRLGLYISTATGA